MKQGDLVTLEHLGERKIRKARKAFTCRGWSKNGNHKVNPGDLYVETEMAPDIAGGFGFYRCCLDCAGLTP